MNNIFSIKFLVADLIKNNKKMREGYIAANWTKIVDNLSEYSKIYYLTDDTLHIKVNSPTILHYMRMNSDIYIDKINTLFVSLMNPVIDSPPKNNYINSEICYNKSAETLNTDILQSNDYINIKKLNFLLDKNIK
ncbi:MAG: DUF721 domain-containing protein [Fusobacteriaceae bacterium]|nr:DUF721 domain-containing protein [Fusobacteriaceae bacterium]